MAPTMGFRGRWMRPRAGRLGFCLHRASGQLRRLSDAPTIRCSNTSDVLDSDIQDATKGYFLDGVSNLYIEQNADLTVSKAWLYPTMRRGGACLWAGCQSLWDRLHLLSHIPLEVRDLGSSRAAGRQGQRSGCPGFGTGGGYDPASTPLMTQRLHLRRLCPSPGGTEIVILDAFTGAVIQQFDPTGAGSFVADVTVEDVDGDGAADFAYAVDAKGSLYRISFGSYSGGVFVPATSASWRIDQVTEISTGSDTKLRFLNKPVANPFLDNQGNRHMYVLLGAGTANVP